MGGLAETKKGTPDFSNPQYFFDRSRDSEMIKRGYNHKFVAPLGIYKRDFKFPFYDY